MIPSGTNKKPVVSVVIPTYNRAHLIGQAIQTVLNQTFQNIEIIIVDDASTDNTEEIVASLKDERILYLRHEKNLGAPAARNTGIKAAKGEYIAFQDSDDEWHPEKLEKQMRVFEASPPEVGVVYTAFLRIVNDKKEYIPYPWVTQKEGDIHKELLKGSFITTPSIIVRKVCFEKTGMFDECLPRLQDWELVIRLSKYYHFGFVNKPLLTSYFTLDSISDSEKARIQALKIIIAKHLNNFLEEKETLLNYYYGIGVYLCLNNEIAEGELYIAKAFEIVPDRRLLSERYFIIGRRLCSTKDIKTGRSYLIKAIRTFPLKIEVLLVVIFSFFGQNVYNKVSKIYKNKE